MTVYRVDVRKVAKDLERQRLQTPESRDTPDAADWNNDIERMQITIRNVLTLHSRGWSVRAIAEDLFPELELEKARGRVERILRTWRSGAPVNADAVS